MKTRHRTSLTVIGAAVAALACAALVGAQDPPSLQKADPPAGGIWVDSLDLSKAPIRRPRAGGAGQRGGTPAAQTNPAAPPPPPPAPLVYTVRGRAEPPRVR